MGFLGKYTEPFYAILRIVAGFLFLCHGLQKIFGMFGGPKMPPSSGMPFIAGVLELVLGLLIMVGLFTSIAAFLASGEMAVGYFVVHQPQGALPIQNQGELAALYCFVFLYMAARGSGIWSLDGAVRRPRPRP